ncbi:MAG: amylo-alpha-1,6-glucosidase, partial [Gemmatimonadota bacterium]
MNPGAEWLETDGLGGYAMGRVDGIRTRRYHALLAVSRRPPTERMTLVNGFDAWVETPGGEVSITSQRYAPDVTHPAERARLIDFTTRPWPAWRFALPDGLALTQELVVQHGAPLIAVSWTLSAPMEATLVVRPFLSVRDTHHTTHENGAFDFSALVAGQRITWHPYGGLPAVTAVTNGEFVPEATWYRNFQYDEERARGLDFVEDLATPGTFRFALCAGRAVLAFASDTAGMSPLLDASAPRLWDELSNGERTRRAAFATPLHRAADAFIVRRGEANGRTIVAGYPWFTDWGRDTFIALRGLCIVGDRLHDARAILLEWAQHVDAGMLPNFFPEGGAAAEYNSVDASLWYVIAVHDYLAAVARSGGASDGDEAVLRQAVIDIVSGYARGTRFGIGADVDGLLSAGVPGVQLTWMDAKVGDWVVTPRIGKPVEIQALWSNALRVAARWEPNWRTVADRARAAFIARFWSEERGVLADVVDVDHQPGVIDVSLRPNQLFAVGGLPWPLVDGEMARRVVERCEAALWTPAGLRSLAAGDTRYVGHYGGDIRQRDGSYHQGTVWPWLAGPFIDAWVRAHGGTDDAKREARRRFLDPLLAHYTSSAPGQLGEIADGDAPHVPNGCPFQAWSVGEALRLSESVLAVD